MRQRRAVEQLALQRNPVQTFPCIWLELEFCTVMLDFQKPYTVGNEMAHLIKVLAANCGDLSLIPGTRVVEE